MSIEFTYFRRNDNNAVPLAVIDKEILELWPEVYPDAIHWKMVEIARPGPYTVTSEHPELLARLALETDDYECEALRVVNELLQSYNVWISW